MINKMVKVGVSLVTNLDTTAMAAITRTAKSMLSACTLLTKIPNKTLIVTTMDMVTITMVVILTKAPGVRDLVKIN